MPSLQKENIAAAGYFIRGDPQTNNDVIASAFLSIFCTLLVQQQLSCPDYKNRTDAQLLPGL